MDGKVLTKEQLKAMAKSMQNTFRLHLGCGTNYLDGYTNVDIDPTVKTDWCGDCNNMPIEWDDTFDHIYSSHSLEHFKDLFKIVDELARVSKNGATWEIVVPMWSHSQNMGNPHHYLNFSPTTFKFFDREDGIYRRGQSQPYSLKEVVTTSTDSEIIFMLKIEKD